MLGGSKFGYLTSSNLFQLRPKTPAVLSKHNSGYHLKPRICHNIIMTENPLINALSATLYISVVASGMFFTEKSPEPVYPLLVGIAMLSLFVLSVAVMGYIFFYRPVILIAEGKKVEALHFFLKTTGYFAIITLSIFLVLFITTR